MIYCIQKNCDFAVVLASYYGGKGYSTHNEEYAIKKYNHLKKLEYSHQIIDKEGNYYAVHYDRLVKTDGHCKIS